MTTDIFFLFSGRGGSHLIGQLLSACSDFNLEGGLDYQSNSPAKGPEDQFYIATKPSYIAPLYTPGYDRLVKPIGSIFNTKSKYPFRVYCSYVGDHPSCFPVNPQVPMMNMPWRTEEIQKFSKNRDFRIIHSIRDGRNQLASWKQLEISSNKDTYQWNDMRWMTYCHEFQCRARIALQSNQDCDNYKLIYFEDLVMNTRQTLEEIVEFTDLPLDLEGKISQAMELIEPNSSFQQRRYGGQQYETRQDFLNRFRKSDILKRWQVLSIEEKEYLYQVARHELYELGYTNSPTDRSWVEEKSALITENNNNLVVDDLEHRNNL